MSTYSFVQETSGVTVSVTATVPDAPTSAQSRLVGDLVLTLADKIETAMRGAAAPASPVSTPFTPTAHAAEDNTVVVSENDTEQQPMFYPPAYDQVTAQQRATYDALDVYYPAPIHYTKLATDLTLTEGKKVTPNAVLGRLASLSEHGLVQRCIALGTYRVVAHDSEGNRL